MPSRIDASKWVTLQAVTLLKQLLSRIPPQRRKLLSVSGYIHTHMAEGMAAMAEEEQSRAIPHFEIVLMLAAVVLIRKVVGTREIARRAA